MARTLSSQAGVAAGSFGGGILLVTGSCIGAGMLALPVVTGPAGFLPSALMFFVAWFFMMATGLLLLEVNLTVGTQLSLVSLVERTLGRGGKVACWVLFLFLFYALNIAYIVAIGALVPSLAYKLCGITLPVWAGSLFATLLFGLVVYRGARAVDHTNRWLVLGLVAAYSALVLLGSAHVQTSYLTVCTWGVAFSALPVLIISFGFHNMIPSLVMYTKGDLPRMRGIILWGSALPLLIYLLWEWVLLGILPREGCQGLLAACNRGEAVTETLRAVVGYAWVAHVAEAFAFFAITTSFLAQTLSLVDFLADGWGVSKVGKSRCFLLLLALLPPLLFALLYPHIFILALQWAGGFAAVILFGVMPILMVWRLRYRLHKVEKVLLPWGRPLLLFLGLLALGIFGIEFLGTFR